MIRYIKCPRCDLNYIDGDHQEYCDVCMKEMKGIALDIDEMDDVDSDYATELCPICGENMMRAGDKMCEDCRKKAEYEEEEPNPDDEDDDEWREYLDDDTDADLDSELGEDLTGEFEADLDDEEEEEDEEYIGDDEEGLEYVTGDEIYSIGDDEEDEEDDDEDF